MRQRRQAQAIAIIDNSFRFVTERVYQTSNPAMNAIRAPLAVGLWVMLALAAVMLIWGMLVPIDSAAVAKGSVTLLSNKKTVQHLEGGIIQEILVKEGQTVVQGQPLVRLVNASASSSLDIVKGQLYMARAAKAKLMAESKGLDAVSYDKDMATGKEAADAVAAQDRLFVSETEGQKAKLAILDKRIAQSQQEISGLQAQTESASGQMEKYKEELALAQPLLEKGYDTKPHLLELQRHIDELKGNIGQSSANIARLEQNIAETRMQIINQQKEFETKTAQDLRDAQSQISDLQDKLRSATDVVDRTLVTAPVGGIITGLKYHTAKGVIPPGAPIMDIVPQDDLLIVEAKLKPNDISVVHPGLEAKVLFTSYKMRSTPKVPGKVVQVSPDTFTDEHGGSPYYKVQVQVDKKFLQGLGRPIELYPGMPADVLVRTGSRSFVSYLFRPITDSMHSAFREE